MFRNDLKIALRNFWKNKTFSVINIAGLSIGIATCLIIMLFVKNELSYDRFNALADRIVRVEFRGSMRGEKIKEADVMPPVARTFLKEYPEVQEATRLQSGDRPVIAVGDKAFEEPLAFVDPNFFRVFSIPLIRGNAATALTKPNTVVISRQVARTFFGNESPVGKFITAKTGGVTLTVTGVFDEIPAQSHFHFDLLASMTTLPDTESDSWMSSGFYTYLVLPKGYDPRKLEAKLPSLVEKYMGPQVHQAFGMPYAEFQKKGNEIGFILRPLTDIHLHSDANPMTELEPAGDIRYVYLFSAIALFMLLIACVNFMNLSTANAGHRAREVGVRKVLGSGRTGLMRQFLVESILTAILALVISLLLIRVALPFFNRLADKKLDFPLLHNPWMLPGLLVFGLVTGLLAGSYPAFFLSSFKPAAVLKKKMDAGRGSLGFRSSLVVFQFFIAIVLIISTMVVYHQLQYIRHIKLGYDKDQVLILDHAWMLGGDQAAFGRQLPDDPGVKSVSSSDYLPAGISNGNNYLAYADGHDEELVKSVDYQVDEQYIPTLGIQLAAGRNFSKDFPTDSTAIILNQTAVKAYGLGNEPLGHTLTHADNQGIKQTFHVIGIVNDFHFKSLHETISPLVMTLGNGAGTFILKVSAGQIPTLLSTIRRQWASYHSAAPLSYSFLDDRFENTYAGEQKTADILGIFAALTIFVTCLGLFGLAIFTAEKRIKEIGIRKVLGASVSGIAALLAKDFLKLVLIAFALASPFAWFLMNKWLQGFAYRTSLNIWIFVVTILLAGMISLVTIGSQAIRAAISNPVNNLRSE